MIYVDSEEGFCESSEDGSNLIWILTLVVFAVAVLLGLLTIFLYVNNNNVYRFVAGRERADIRQLRTKVENKLQTDSSQGI